ncbi:WD40 domain-containing protein [Lyngbya aestuarii]|uniref:WD40 domain-containing protein n=1 Tax=Lyngbya aestuarii TaxID=118322 RepID=UPI00403DDB80
MTNYQYQVGGSLAQNAPTYVVRQSDHQLYEALKQRDFCYVLNSRQMGKSSLLVRTRHLLQQQGTRCSTLDMSRIGSENITPVQWYKGVISELCRDFQLLGKIHLKSWWREQEDFPIIQRLSNFLEDVLLAEFATEKLVIFIDEIDSILSLNFSIDDFFALIRFCYNQRAINPEYNRLTFALFGVATPSDLIADKKRTPFNIGKAIKLHGFQPEEAQPLVKGLAAQFDNAPAILQEILAWTGGQPFLTQKLCQLMITNSQGAVSEGMKIPRGMEAFWVESVIRKGVINKWESQDEPEHLRTIGDRLFRQNQLTGRLLGTYQQLLQGTAVASDDSQEQVELLLSGLVVKQQGYLQLRNRIYAEVFNLTWIEQQLAALRPYSQTLDAWIASGKTDKSRLLRGQALKDAQHWLQGKSLSNLDYHFLAASQEFDRQEVQATLKAERAQAIKAQLGEEQKRLALERRTAKRLQRLIGALSLALVFAIGSGMFAIWQYQQAVNSERNARISEIQALSVSSKGLFASQHRLDALVAAIKAQRRLSDLKFPNPQLQSQVSQVLQQAIYSTRELNRLSGHHGAVLAVDVSPDGQLIATGSNDRSVKLWQRDGTLLQSLSHGGTVHALSFSPNGQRLVSSSLDGKIYLWNSQGSLLKTFQGHNSAIWGIAMSPDGQRIASASEDGTIRLWNSHGKLLRTITGHETAVRGVAFSPQGNLLASSGQDGKIKLWKLDGTLVRTLEGHSVPVWDLKFALLKDTDGTKRPIIISGSADRTIKLWQPDGTLLRTLEGHQAEVFEVAVSTAGDLIASSSADQTVNLWRPDGTLLRVLKGHQSAIRGVAFIPDSSMVVSASDDNTARLWQPNNSFVQVLPGHLGTIFDVDFSPDSQLIASASTDQTFKLWTREGALLKSLTEKAASVYGVAFVSSADLATSEKELLLATASGDNTVKLWQLDGTLLKSFAGHTATVWDVTFSPDSQLFASASADKTVKLWRLDGSLLRTFEGHRARVYDVDFSPDGKMLASASEDGTVKLWSFQGVPLRTLQGHSSGVWEVAISPDGQTIATASLDDTIKLWTRQGKLLKTLQGDNRGVTSAVFSPDGQMLVAGGVAGALKLWRVDGTEATTLIGHEAGIWDVNFSPDGKQIASVGDDQTVIVWNVEQIFNLDEITYACEWVQDYLRTNLNLSQEDKHICDRIQQHPNSSKQPH